MKMYKKNIIQFIKYFGVALVGYVFDFGILYLATEFLNINYLIAAASGFIVGLLVVFLLSSKYVFGESKINSKSTEFGLFALIGLIGLAILTILMWLLTDKLHFNYLISKIVATIFVYAWNFFARKSLYHN